MMTCDAQIPDVRMMPGCQSNCLMPGPSPVVTCNACCARRLASRDAGQYDYMIDDYMINDMIVMMMMIMIIYCV